MEVTITQRTEIPACRGG